MRISCLTAEVSLPACDSLKEKRSRLRPALARVQREFSVSAAEVDWQDRLDTAVLAFVLVSNDARHNRQVLQKILTSLQRYSYNLEVEAHSIEDLI